MIASFIFASYSVFICGSDFNMHPHMTQGEYRELCLSNGMWKWWIVTPACMTLCLILNISFPKKK